jgi:hypothetical protein
VIIFRRRTSAAICALLAVGAAAINLPRAAIAAPHLSYYQLTGQGTVDPDLLYYASNFTIDRQGGEHVAGFVIDGRNDRLVYLTRKAGASKWTRANTGFTVPDTNETKLEVMQSADRKRIDVVFTTCTGGYSTSTPIGSTDLPDPTPVATTFACDDPPAPSDEQFMAGAVALPHNRAMILVGGGHILTGAVGGRFAAPAAQPRLGRHKRAWPDHIARDRRSGEIVMTAVRHGSATHGDKLGLESWSQARGGEWTGPRLVKSTIGHHYAVEGLVIAHGRVTVGVAGGGDKCGCKNRLRILNRSKSGKWGRVRAIPHTVIGFELTLMPDPDAHRVYAAYLNWADPCPSICGIVTRYHHHGRWSKPHQQTHNGGDNPLGLQVTPNGRPVVAFHRQ